MNKAQFKKKYGYVDNDWDKYNTKMARPKKLIDRKVFVEAGRKGGLETAKRGAKFYSKNGEKGMKSRWSKKKATNEVASSSDISNF